MLLARVDSLHYLFIIPLCLVSLFLVLIILVQRGRGGGLTGALGGMGGASAFGTKAGDLFTRITIGVAAVWILLSMAALKVLNDRSPLAKGGPRTNVVVPGETDESGLVPKADSVPGGDTVPDGKTTSPKTITGKTGSKSTGSKTTPTKSAPAKSAPAKSAPATPPAGDSNP